MSQPRIVTLSLMRNESSRFLPQALRAWMEFSDEVFILDDGSTDGSPKLARSLGAEVVEMAEEDPAWGQEWPKRQRLFTAGMERLDDGDYAIILDCDMIPLRDPRPLIETEPEAVAFVLYDLWHAEIGRFWYRCDGLWRGHVTPRVWMVRKPREPSGGWEWNERGLHCGHLPANLELDRVLFAPPDYGLLHLAYLTTELRKGKHSAYMREADQLTEEEVAHAESIIDSAPRLEPLPHTPDYEILR